MQRLAVITGRSPGDGELTQVLVIPSERVVCWHGAPCLNQRLFAHVSIPLRDIADAFCNPCMGNVNK